MPYTGLDIWVNGKINYDTKLLSFLKIKDKILFFLSFRNLSVSVLQIEDPNWIFSLLKYHKGSCMYAWWFVVSYTYQDFSVITSQDYKWATLWTEKTSIMTYIYILYIYIYITWILLRRCYWNSYFFPSRTWVHQC